MHWTQLQVMRHSKVGVCDNEDFITTIMRFIITIITIIACIEDFNLMIISLRAMYTLVYKP